MEKDKNCQPEESYYGVGSFIFELVKIFLLALIIIIPIRVFLFQPFFVQGASMEPNFENNEYLIINELGYKKVAPAIGGHQIFDLEPFKGIDRQTVIVFRYPVEPWKFFIKRVVGLPGEKLEIKDSKVIIYNSQNPNGFVLDESKYLADTVKTGPDTTSPVLLGDDEYFVMGDNRLQSSDSRFWGPIKKSDVIGKVLLRAWPLNNIKIF